MGMDAATTGIVHVHLSMAIPELQAGCESCPEQTSHAACPLNQIHDSGNLLQHLVRLKSQILFSHLLLQQVGFDALLQGVLCCCQLITLDFKRLDLWRMQGLGISLCRPVYCICQNRQVTQQLVS